MMKRLTVFKLFVTDQDDALAFYTQKLGFEVAEDKRMGDYRWLIVRLPDNRAAGINLALATSDEQRALVGKQAAGDPLFGIETDDCLRDYREMKARGVSFMGEPEVRPYGTGVMLQDLYGT